MGTAIQQFCHLADLESYSKTATYLARWKIKPLFFQHLFYRLVHWHFQYISRQTWKGLQLLAVDGTAFRVPDSVENRRFFGQHTNQHDSIASCRLLVWFDILNDLIVGVSFLDQHTYKTAHFDWLYQKRWRVETCFDRLKNQLMLGSFSAYRLHFVWQDIWCSVYSGVSAPHYRRFAPPCG